MVTMSTQGGSTPSPSSSSSRPWWKYEVFLSFRGVDTRRSFTDHLYAALKKKGILTFRDDEELEIGKSISPELLKAIERSRFAIIILSRNYAFSTWCLDELVNIVRCMKENGMTVLPVFYDVDPSTVRKQTGTFEKAFVEHVKHFKENTKKVEMWRAALIEVANLSGWHLQDRHEVKFIQNIVGEILHKLRLNFSIDTKNLVGIDSSVEELITSYLGLGNNVCMIGICGMGGIGKTTLARVVYDMFSNHFEGSSFITNVREVSEKDGLLPLQKQLLAQILGETNINIWDVVDGVKMIRKMLNQKKVLLVLDDVNQSDQLENLAGKHDWFGLGSRIIITTRDEHLLVQHGVHQDKIYRPNTLNDQDALKLFCLKAFRNEQPREGYLEISRDVVYYAKGLPLALVILGSFLAGRTMDVWQSALESFKKIPKREIVDILKVSYDGLEEMYKEIFLDIVCFFIGEMKNRVVEILKYCGFEVEIGINVLMDKSLLTVKDEKLWTHDLLQVMGREIIRRESREEPGKRSRLWLRKDLFHVLTKDTVRTISKLKFYLSKQEWKATKAIQAIALKFFEGERAYRNYEATPIAFSKMCNLRLLIIDGVQIPNGLNHLSNDLRVLEWDHYSSICLPSSFQPIELVELRLQWSKIKYLWEGVKYLEKLRFIDLSNSTNLIKAPEFKGLPNLERLHLANCTSLVKIHPSIGQLSRLIVLDLENCHSLINLPSMRTEMESLTILNLYGCSKIKEIPEFNGILKSLSELYLGNTAFEKLPSSIKCLTALTLLDLRHCRNLKSLPNNVGTLRSLKKLVLYGCLKLANLPKNILQIKYLTEFEWSGNASIETPQSNLDLSPQLFSNLQKFDLRGYFNTLPASINLPAGNDLVHCYNVQSFPELSSTVRSIKAQYHHSLEPSPQSVRRQSSVSRPYFDSHRYNDSSDRVAFKILNHYLQGFFCPKTGNETSTKRKETGSGTSFHLIFPGIEIPKWLTHQSLGNSISIELPPNWSNKKLMGFNLCACFDALYPPVPIDNFDASGEIFGLRARVIALGDMPHSHYISETFSSVTSGVDQIWLLYISRDNWFPTVHGECNWIMVVFETSSPHLYVRRCGVSLVYEQDMKEFRQVIARCGNNNVAGVANNNAVGHGPTWTHLPNGRKMDLEFVAPAESQITGKRKGDVNLQETPEDSEQKRAKLVAVSSGNSST